MTRYYVRKWAVRDWRVMRKDFYSPVSHTVSKHTTKQGAYAALTRMGAS